MHLVDLTYSDGIRRRGARCGSIKGKAAVIKPEADHLKAATGTRENAMTDQEVRPAMKVLNPEIQSLTLLIKTSCLPQGFCRQNALVAPDRVLMVRMASKKMVLPAIIKVATVVTAKVHQVKIATVVSVEVLPASAAMKASAEVLPAKNEKKASEKVRAPR